MASTPRIAVIGSANADLMLDALFLNAALFAAAAFGFIALLDSARREGSRLQSGE